MRVTIEECANVVVTRTAPGQTPSAIAPSTEGLLQICDTSTDVPVQEAPFPAIEDMVDGDQSLPAMRYY